MSTCVAVFGPPGSGKTTLCRQFAEQNSHAVTMLSIGDVVRASATNRDVPSLVAERALDAACRDLPHGHVLLLDGLKRASHVLSSLEVLSRHGVRLKTAIQLTDVRQEAGSRGRLDDNALHLRVERYEADKPQLLRTLQAASVKVVTHSKIVTPSRLEACLADLTSACATPAQSIDWKACGGVPPQLDLPIQVTNIDQLGWIAFPGRYTVGVKVDGERAFLVVQNDRLWLSFRSGVEREWEPWATLDVNLSHGTVLDGEFIASSNQFIAFDLLRLPGRSLEREPLDCRLDELIALGLPRAGAVQVNASAGVEEQFSRLHVHTPSPASLETDLHSSSKSPLSVRLTEPLDAASLKRALASNAIPSDGLVFSPRELPCGWGKTFKWQAADQIRADLCVIAIEASIDFGQQFRVKLSFCASASSPQPTTIITFPNLPPSAVQLAKGALLLSARFKSNSSDTDIASTDSQWKSLAEMCDRMSRTRFRRQRSLDKAELANFLGTDSNVPTQTMLKTLGDGLLDGLLVEVGAEADEQLATELAALLSKPRGGRGGLFLVSNLPIFACRLVTPKPSAGDGTFSASVSFAASNNQRQPNGWMPAARRFDKSNANSALTVEAVKAAATNPALSTASALQDSMLRSIHARSKDVMSEEASARPQPPHAALQIPFADFRQLLDEAADSIEQTPIDGTELIVLNARSAPVVSSNISTSNILAMCRGLVISESAVIAAPFCKFGSAAETICPDQLVEATEKIDGSHIIAFVWQGEIITCTKRRADSEQALWSKAYLQHRGVALTPGFTYMFEAVYRDSAVVVKYQQDECVLIAARDDSGIELDRAALVAEGRRIQLPVVVMMKGHCAEFVQDAEDASDLNSEGWVLKSFDGNGGILRGKVIRKAWSRASRASVHHVSPLAAAHAFGTSDEARFAPLSLAAHHQLELEVMREALLCYWLRLRRRLGGLLAMSTEASLDSPLVECTLSRTAAALRRVLETKHVLQRNLATDRISLMFHKKLDPAFNYLQPPEDGHFMADPYTLAENVLCLLVRARCIDGTIPGYSASICAKSTLAKGWARQTPVESSSVNASTSSLPSLPLELLEPVLAHLDGYKNISLVCRGLYQAVYASAEVAQHAIERATCQLEHMADKRFARPMRSHYGRGQSYGHVSFGGYNSDSN